MWITVDAYEYHAFFEVLANAFKKEYGEECPHEWDDRNLWKLGIRIRDKKIKYRSTELFGAPNAYSHEYFWVRNNDAKKAIEKSQKIGEEGTIQVNAAALILAFDYLGEYLDLTIFKKPPGEKTKAKSLWAQFFARDDDGLKNAEVDSDSIAPDKDHNLIGKDILSILDEEKTEYHKFRITPNQKTVLYEYIFNVAKPNAKRIKAIYFFTIHKLLTDDEICNLILNYTSDISYNVYGSLSSLLSEENDREGIFSFALRHANEEKNHQYIKYLLYDIMQILPHDRLWLYNIRYFILDASLETPVNDIDSRTQLTAECILYFLTNLFSSTTNLNFDEDESDELFDIISKCWYINQSEECQKLVNEILFNLKTKHSEFYNQNCNTLVSELNDLTR